MGAVSCGEKRKKLPKISVDSLPAAGYHQGQATRVSTPWAMAFLEQHTAYGAVLGGQAGHVKYRDVAGLAGKVCAFSVLI